ncbi:MAG TPA: sec-independent translocase [Jatrophihabitans sp.]
MFNIGPLEFIVLAAVAMIVFGPEKIPQLTKDAARMIKTLRDMAQGARTQLTSELGPEFANFDLNSLNPKTAIRNALLDEGEDFSSLDPRQTFQKMLNGDDSVNLTKKTDSAPPAASGPLASGEKAPFDPDTT